MYGAIGDCLDRPVFMKGKSTNEDEFCSFIRKVAKHVKCEYVGSKRPVVILDNASGHRSKKSRKLLSEHFFPVFMPPHSSFFNSVERVWSVSKHNFAVLSLQCKEEMKKKEFDAMVVKACSMISRKAASNICRSNRAEIHKFLLMRAAHENHSHTESVTDSFSESN